MWRDQKQLSVRWSYETVTESNEFLTLTLFYSAVQQQQQRLVYIFNIAPENPGSFSIKMVFFPLLNEAV